MITSASHESVLRMLAEVLAEKPLGKFRQRAPSHSDSGPPSPVIEGSFASAGIHLAVLIWLSCSLFSGDGGGGLPILKSFKEYLLSSLNMLTWTKWLMLLLTKVS